MEKDRFEKVITRRHQIIVMMLAGGGFAAYAIATAPELDESKLRDALPLKISEQQRRSEREQRMLSMKEVPDVVKDAFISIEDPTFLST